jgi:alkanesulfonate monooxygenase SsuD/methylene tetrahydromethanopterin reductase-like flavin-dependent oxidoreductase (luciferase family)
MAKDARRQLHLWAFLQGIGHYPGGWRYRGARPEAVFDADYYAALGRLTERGRFDAIVFGDQLHGRDAAGRAPSRLAAPTLDPFTLLSLIAGATRRIGLVATVSTTYNEPLVVAEKFATLDVLSRGRAGWNIVTTAHPASPWNFGEEVLPEKSLRYARADEFVEVASAFWAAARPGGEANGDIAHQGRWFAVKGALSTPRPPQGRPVLVQAGQSSDGRDFAARTAEAIFCPASRFEDGKAYRDDMRARLPRFGRDPDDVKIMPGLSFVLASTEAEAIAKDKDLLDLATPDLCIEYLGESIGFDLTRHDPEGPIPLTAILATCEFPADYVRQVLARPVEQGLGLAAFASSYARTPRGHQTFRGTPEQLADMMQHWLEEGACDGFTLQPAYMPGELELFVDEVTPLLQRRGVLRTDYEHATLRGHLGLGAL